MADATDGLGPIDQFKREHHPIKKKGDVAGKPNHEYHWKNTNVISDPVIKSKWQPKDCWSGIDK